VTTTASSASSLLSPSVVQLTCKIAILPSTFLMQRTGMDWKKLNFHSYSLDHNLLPNALISPMLSDLQKKNQSQPRLTPQPSLPKPRVY
jgi:hypothetical protein